MGQTTITVQRGEREGRVLVCPTRVVSRRTRPGLWGDPDALAAETTAGGAAVPTHAGTVYLEPGLGLGAESWTRVVRALAGMPIMRGWRLVSMDRAGWGESSPAPDPRTLDDMLADQAAVLDALIDEGRAPLILVGHSWGGTLLRLWIAEHPGLADGLVLVDASYEGGHEHYDDGFIGRLRESAEHIAMEIAEWFHVVSPAGRENAAHARTQELAVFQESLDRLQGEDLTVGASGTEVPGSTVLVTTRKLKGGQVDIQREFARRVGAVVVPSATRSHMIPEKDPKAIAKSVAALVTAIDEGETLV